MGKNIEKHCPELLLQTDAHSCSAEALEPKVAYSIGFLSGSMHHLPGAGEQCDCSCWRVAARWLRRLFQASLVQEHHLAAAAGCREISALQIFRAAVSLTFSKAWGLF